MSLKSEKLFVYGRTYGCTYLLTDISDLVSNVIRWTRRSRPNNTIRYHVITYNQAFPSADHVLTSSTGHLNAYGYLFLHHFKNRVVYFLFISFAVYIELTCRTIIKTLVISKY